MKSIKPSVIGLYLIATFAACQKNYDITIGKEELSPSEISMIEAAGFQSNNALRMGSDYLVEGDILITSAQLNLLSGNNGFGLVIAKTEQYRATNIVTSLPRTIKIKYTGTQLALKNALANAILRYNNLNLRLKFLRVSSTSYADITLKEQDPGGGAWAASYLPRGGNPGTAIQYNPNFIKGYSSGSITSTVAHEMGHCIGFQHTDYMDNSFSCSKHHYSEASNTGGFVKIPGTPTGPDSESWMLACLPVDGNRGFNTNDKIALNYLY